MHFTPQEMSAFIKSHLGPQLKKDQVHSKILIYDQNKGDDMAEWVDIMLNDKELAPWIYGTAVHWYSSTYKYFPESLRHAHDKAPSKRLIHTEGCIDSEIPNWKDDEWYWKKEATDWGWEWANEEDKHNHPKYVPAYRYARDIIGCLNNWVEGWIDWNMVLNEKGGPNLAQNWCIAPVLVDVAKDEVYYTPMYFVMSHFSKYIRPGAARIDFQVSNESLMVTAAKNRDGSIALVVFNEGVNPISFEVVLGEQSVNLSISERAIQTIVIPKKIES